MVRIRLRRVGAKNQPSYRIVAAEKEAPRDGRFLEVLGHYNPRTEPSTVQVDEQRLFHWMSNGAQPSESVFRALKSLGTWDRWERFKQGESIDKLLEEAKKAVPEVDPRTRRDDLFGKSKKKKSKKADKEPTAEAQADATVEEVEAPAAEPEPAEEAPPEAKADEAVEEAEAGTGAEEAEPVSEPEAESEAESTAEAEVETEAADEAPDEAAEADKEADDEEQEA